jgi:hypothetical protein
MAYALIWNQTASGPAISPAVFAAGDKRKPKPGDSKVLLESSRNFRRIISAVGRMRRSSILS